jgi:hypothetical protein
MKNKPVTKLRAILLPKRQLSVLKTTTGLKLVLIISKRASVGYCTVKKEVKYDKMAIRVL